MLDIKKVQSTNEVTIMGTLNELNIEEKVSGEGKEYVQGTASIKVDQEIGGKHVENIVPIRMFSMRLKKDGEKNVVYDGIVKMKESLTSLAAAETPSQASKVIINGKQGQLQENMWLDKTTNQLRTAFQISSNFMKKANPEDEEKATFELSGVVGDIRDEMDKDGNETGRLILKFIVVGYLGKTDVIQLIAENPTAVNHIRNNWEKGDTVSLTGIINMSYTVKTWTEEQGFGEPIKRTRTESKRELIITGGSPTGLDEELSYDMDAIKLALDERQTRIDKLSEKKPATSSTNKSFNVGF